MIDRTEFSNWLKSLPPHQVVGEAGSLYLSPLSLFLATKGVSARITPDAYWVDDAFIPLEPWARELVRQIDKCPPDDPFVSASFVVELLGEVL